MVESLRVPTFQDPDCQPLTISHRLPQEVKTARTAPQHYSHVAMIVVLKVVEISVVFIIAWKALYIKDSTGIGSNISQPYSDALYTITDLCTATGKVCELCPLSWVPFNGKCYFLSEDRNNWSSSNQYCEQRNADILSMEDFTKQEFISKHISVKSGHFWIGLTREGSHWVWKTGRKLKDHISITSSDHKCATFGREILPESCFNTNKWICEKNISRYLT
ncbi:C-type lectin domain family 2 member B-like [Mixophyes fleayi]|uniref:C-type lectin domain family 2 member B-like n=1 Tax=Mixophyes fleayi TaxID=3061075 RepID=UPI003F4E3D03